MNIIDYTPKVETLESKRELIAEIKKLRTPMAEAKRITNFEDLELEDLTCPICMSFCAEPTLTPCHHIFCMHCLEQCMCEKEECPMCRSNLNFYHAEINKELQDYIKTNFKEEFESRKQELVAQDLWLSDMCITNVTVQQDWEEINNPTVGKGGKINRNKTTFTVFDKSNLLDYFVESIELIFPAEFNKKSQILNKENSWKFTDVLDDSYDLARIELNIKYQERIGADVGNGFLPLNFMHSGSYGTWKVWDSPAQNED